MRLFLQPSEELPQMTQQLASTLASGRSRLDMMVERLSLEMVIIPALWPLLGSWRCLDQMLVELEPSTFQVVMSSGQASNRLLLPQLTALLEHHGFGLLFTLPPRTLSRDHLWLLILPRIGKTAMMTLLHLVLSCFTLSSVVLMRWRPMVWVVGIYLCGQSKKQEHKWPLDYKLITK